MPRQFRWRPGDPIDPVRRLDGSPVSVTFNNVAYPATVLAGTTAGTNLIRVVIPTAAVNALTDGNYSYSAAVTNAYGSITSQSGSVEVDTHGPLAPQRRPQAMLGQAVAIVRRGVEGAAAVGQRLREHGLRLAVGHGGEQVAQGRRAQAQPKAAGRGGKQLAARRGGRGGIRTHGFH